MSGAFSSRWALLLATLGMAIGTGNLWRFPRILSQNGGGTFLIPWAIFLFTWSIPLLMAEFAIGRASRRGPVGAYSKIFGPGTAWRGGFVTVCTVAIMCYYSVVSGWTLRYAGLALTGGLAGLGPADGEPFFLDYTKTWWPALTHVLSMGICCGVVALGVTGGIERVCKILVPALFVVLVVCAVQGLSLDGSEDGLAFLTTFELSRLWEDHTIWLEALSQSAWSTGAGWGLMIGYALYAGAGLRSRRECVSTGLGNNSASLLAALAVLPAVFALAPLAGEDPTALVQESGPASTGLTFVWMPVLFQEMPGGAFFGALFFAGLAFAALSSLIAMVELAVRTFEDGGMTRSKAVVLVFVAGFLLGLPSAVNLGWPAGEDGGLTAFQNQDWVWGVGLIVSGALTGFSVLRYGPRRFHRELIQEREEGPSGGGGGFVLAITWLVPIQAVGLLGWWFYKAFTWVSETDADGTARSLGSRIQEWLDPSNIFGVGTCLLQWGVVLAILLLVNRRLAAPHVAPHVATGGD